MSSSGTGRLAGKVALITGTGRVGQPEDIARAALFLASDDSEWISGANIVVDGGLTTLG
jgi:enoyl-[acyl-carrier-protein] reductase (NADH)